MKKPIDAQSKPTTAEGKLNSRSPIKLIHAIAENDSRLSRTSTSGKVDQTVSIQKLPLRITGTHLLESISSNRENAANFIVNAPINAISDAENLLASILTIANLTLLGTLPEGLFRKWELPPDRTYGKGPGSIAIAPSEIQEELIKLCRKLTSLPSRTPIERAALAEWSIGIGPIHPFYDGCGRISRHVSALILSIENIPLKAHKDRPTYLQAGIQGEEGFIEYYKTLEDLPL